MTEEEIVDCVRKIRKGKSGGGRDAPHKPMLLLLALKLHQEGVVDIPYETIRAEMRWLLGQFNPGHSRARPEFPFWFLRFDAGGRLWEPRIHPDTGFEGSHGSWPKDADLRRLGATGRLGQGVLDALATNPLLGARLVGVTLDCHIAPPLQAPILEALGMDLGLSGPGTDDLEKKENPIDFRREVLLAYNSQCAICDFTVAMKNTFIALEAAHIRWRSEEGPDIVSNGIALCANHHRMFDRGVFTLEGPEKGYKIRISKDAQFPGGIEKARRTIRVMRFSPPLREGSNPDPLFLEWHRDNVFERRMRRARETGQGPAGAG